MCSTQRSCDFLLNVNIGPIVVVGWDEEIARLLPLQWHDLTIGCEFVGAREFVLWVLVHVQLLILLGGLYQVALDEHLYFEREIVLIGVASYTQEIEAVLLVYCILHVVELAAVVLEELIRSWVRCELDCFVQLVKERPANVLDQPVRRAFLRLLDLLELDILRDVLLVELHIDLSVRVDVDHPLLVGVLISSFREVLLHSAVSR